MHFREAESMSEGHALYVSGIGEKKNWEKDIFTHTNTHLYLFISVSRNFMVSFAYINYVHFAPNDGAKKCLN